VHKTKSPTGIDVAVKILQQDAWKDDKAKQRTMKEIYVLERCSDHDVHIVRVLDVFLDNHHRQMHIVMELWGESGETYRRRKGFGRLEPQSTTQVRTLLLHVCRGLSYLHFGLGMCHTDVKLANILIIDKFGGFVNDIECKLADVGSVEEVTSLLSPSRTGNPYPPHPTRGLNVHICFQAAPTG
jgi:serine/threonine protein kinase